ncbi:MAG: TlpA disulfide reductase family protein [Ignavibacteriaceae bacterium]
MKSVQFLFLLLFSSVIIYGCTPKNDNAEVEVIEEDLVKEEIPAEEINSNQVKPKAPEFNLKSTDGKDVKLSDYSGKIVILDFWATWCGPCRMGVPDLVELQNEYKDKLVVIGISLDQVSGTVNDVKPFMQEYKINYPVIFGNEQIAMDYGNIQAIPTSFIIDQQGNVTNRYVGLTHKSEYVKQIKALLGKS